jgi:pyruvate-formate lyase-activating enzyme
VELDVAKDFIRREIEADRCIQLSGGEITLFQNAVEELLKYGRSLGGYVIANSNASNPEALDRLAEFASAVQIDVKGPPSKVESITGVPIDLCWTNPMRVLELSSRWTCDFEVVTPIFDFTTLDDLELIARYIPRHAFWTLKMVTPRLSRYRDCKEVERFNRRPDLPALKAPTPDTIRSLYESLLTDFPEMQGRLTALIGPGRDQIVLDESGEYHFTRPVPDH